MAECPFKFGELRAAASALLYITGEDAHFPAALDKARAFLEKGKVAPVREVRNKDRNAVGFCPRQDGDYAANRNDTDRFPELHTHARPRGAARMKTI
jgi:hypothetical protein